jgi:hypothetical protein
MSQPASDDGAAAPHPPATARRELPRKSLVGRRTQSAALRDHLLRKIVDPKNGRTKYVAPKAVRAMSGPDVVHLIEGLKVRIRRDAIAHRPQYRPPPGPAAYALPTTLAGVGSPRMVAAIEHNPRSEKPPGPAPGDYHPELVPKRPRTTAVRGRLIEPMPRTFNPGPNTYTLPTMRGPSYTMRARARDPDEGVLSPGPCSYRTPSDFDPRPGNADCTPRGGGTIPAEPGPGYYDCAGMSPQSVRFVPGQPVRH